MMMMFFIFSLLVIPAIYINASHNGLQRLPNYMKARFSLGNLGFSQDICDSMYLGLNKPQTFSCEEGKIKVLNNFGIIPLDASNKAYCGSRDENKEVSKCNAQLKADLFEKDFA